MTQVTKLKETQPADLSDSTDSVYQSDPTC